MSDTSNSFFSSIKGRLSRAGSNASNRPVQDGQQNTRAQTRGVNPFTTPASIPAAPPSEPPPAYQAAPPVAFNPRAPSPTPSRLSAITATTPEDQYAFLSSFDTIFLIDDSGSMVGRSWREVQSALSSITPVCTEHDADGLDIYFLNHRSASLASPGQGKAAGGYANVTSAATVDRIFTTVRPGGMTPTGTRLNHILKAYLRHYEDGVRRAGGDPDATDVKPINVIMITDGVPSDDPEAVLLSVAQRLDKLEAPPHQVGVQFFQVGNEPGSAEALRVLDDDLAKLGGGVRDMVDTVTFNAKAGSAVLGGSVPVLSAEGILKTVLGAVVKRLDRARIMEEERRSIRSGMLAP
ncbi:unnamed protein product [Discula destructiva]